MDVTRISKIKHPSGDTGSWRAYVFAADEHGSWLFSPQGSRYVARRNGEVIGECQVGQGDRPVGLAVMHLVAPGQWWFAHFYGRHDPAHFTWPDGVAPASPGQRAVAVDVCRPPELVDGAWTYVDLELDLFADGAGLVIVEDEDEFAASCASGVISPHEATAARSALAELRESLEIVEEPFADIAWANLSAALSLDPPPLLDVG